MSESRAQPLVLPDDPHNRRLVDAVHPPGWVNPVPAGRYDLVVVGAGTAGLVSAVGAASLGATVAIVERHLTGGDCLNVGCVPSKSLISAARTAAAARRAGAFGLHPSADADVDFAAVMERMRRVRAGLAPNDSVARLAGLGIDVFLGAAAFADAETVAVGENRLRFKRAVIATGSRAVVPEVPGLEDAGYLTNETIFSLAWRPRHLIVAGAGPIGCELGQAFRRLGSAVTIVTRGKALLPREDPDASAVVARAFDRDGIRVLTGACIDRVERLAGGLRVVYRANDAEGEIAGDALLIAVGRTPNVEGLGLAAAGVAADARGIVVDDRLRTTNARVWAAGDVCSKHKFTHAADAMARVVLRNAFFFGRRRASALVIPWTTYTDPEVAHVGMSASEAGRQPEEVTTLTIPMSRVDRAVLDDEADGFARVHVERRSGRILGATLVASHAGELIGEIAVAMKAGLGLAALSDTVHPYPTQSECWKRLGDEWNRGRLSPAVRRALRTVIRWRR